MYQDNAVFCSVLSFVAKGDATSYNDRHYIVNVYTINTCHLFQTRQLSSGVTTFRAILVSLQS